MSSLYCNDCKQDHEKKLAKWCDRSSIEIENEKFRSQLKEALSIIEESLPIMREKYIRNQWFERIEKLKKEVS